MFVFLSKLLPIFIYPLGLASVLLIVALLLKDRGKKQRVLLILALSILWLGGNRWVAVGLTRSLEWRYLPPEEVPQADAIVLLGGCTDPWEYPRQMVEMSGCVDRVFYAAWLYEHGAAPYILSSGGYLPWKGERTSPAEEMVPILEKLGVPNEVVWLEPKSRNTYENALFAKEILQEKGIDKIILVTSALHMPRSVSLFEHQGFEVLPAPTDYFVTQSLWQSLFRPNAMTAFMNIFPTVDNMEKTTLALKEYIGIIAYHLRGWL